MINRRKTKSISIGGVMVGGNAPVVVQSMTKTDTRDVKATLRQIDQLQDAGCEIVRVAVPDLEAAMALAEIKKSARLPLIADIHFDYRLALEVIKNGIDGLRLNPGNIGGRENVTRVVKAAREKQIPIRIGVNAGSLPVDIDKSLPTADRMVTALMREIELVESLGFDLIKASLKAFDVPTTIEAYRKASAIIDYPLHLGITEAGIPPEGVIRSTAGLAPLLYEGIGDTIRVSLTAPPAEEVETAYEILKSLNLRNRGPVLISCPTCGRTEIDVRSITGQVRQHLAGCPKVLKVAVMGCVVNGPGEARDADIGIAGGKGKAVLFSRGQKIKTIDEADIVTELLAEIDRFPG
ncbi:MAG: flavodoxin-dependent (E)-4-hydroxy-3-methylbut-2-enyl-diphosphate synthase [Dehalococcoidaceae bacterium]|nr:flavodoxin-dependent (E)-4-hydroxy-3-methylbut-2-enyl-diphosphate synthase [Dehalococcoidaceae bacterium]